MVRRTHFLTMVQTISLLHTRTMRRENEGSSFSRTTGSDQHQDGIFSDAEELGQERAASSDKAIETQQETRPDGETRSDGETKPNGEEEGQGNDQNVAKSSSNTSELIVATSNSSPNHAEPIIDENQPRKRMKLRSDTKADLATSDATCDETYDSGVDTSSAIGSRKRRKRRCKKRGKIDVSDIGKRQKLSPKTRGRTNDVSKMAERFASIDIQEQFRTTMSESYKEDQHQLFSTALKEQPSRTITSIDPQHFIHGLSMYRRELEGNLLGERVCRDRYRITLAHFSDDYELAQSNSALFLQWTEHLAADIGPSKRRDARCCPTLTLVMDRIVDICFPKPHEDTFIKVDSDGRPSQDQAGDRKRAAHTVQDWLRLGKRWSQIFQRSENIFAWCDTPGKELGRTCVR